MSDILSNCGQENGIKMQEIDEQLDSITDMSKEKHSTAQRTDIDLGPPARNAPTPKEDVHIYDDYRILQSFLFENNLPETYDRTYKPRTKASDTGISIVLLSSPAECLAFILEGIRQCPGDMLLVLSTSWLVKEKSERYEGLNSLYVKKAITFDRGGMSYLDVFETPRKCTYLVNFLTGAISDGLRSDGESVEQHIDCPMSSSLEMCKRIDDKLLTRILMAEAGVLYPETLAVVYKPAYEYHVPNNVNVRVFVTENQVEERERVKVEVEQFLKSDSIRSLEKVVVKPSGASWHGSKGVSLHEVSDFDGITKAVFELLETFEVENTVLIEAFYGPPTLHNSQIEDLSYRLRAIVCRQTNDRPITTKIVCGIGKKNQPINGRETIPMSFDTVLQIWGMEEKERNRLVGAIKKESGKILECIMKYENSLSSNQKGGIGAQTDLIGIDFVIGEINGQTEPICIEVNSHDCTRFSQRFENMNPVTRGEIVKPLVETIIKRSQMFSMKDKTVLVIGACGFSKRFIWDTYQEYGIKIVLVDPNSSSYVASNVDHFISYNFNNHKEDKQHARNILDLLNKNEIHIEGCITFWEDCVPLAAIICSSLGLRGPGERGATIAKNKTLTHNTLNAITDDKIYFPRPYLYGGKVMHIEKEADISAAVDYVGLPAVMKLEFGSSAVGVKPITDRINACNMFQKLKATLKDDQDHPGVGLGHGNDILLMETLPGTEHNATIIMFNKQLIASFISDRGPTRPGSFTETAASMPTCLPFDRQGQLITAAYQCCTGVGLVDGIFNVEMKMTNCGPKLIEINARMSGSYLRDWILACYGIDILMTSFMICLGIRPYIPTPTPKCHVMGTMCVSSAHKNVFKDNIKLNMLHNLIQDGAVKYSQIEATLEDCGKEDEEKPFCNIAVVENDSSKAKRKLVEICTSLGVHHKQYDVNYFLSDFK